MSEQKVDFANLSVAELLSMSAESVGVLQPYTPKPAGHYRFEIVGCETITVGGEEKMAAQMKLKILELIDLVDEEEAEEVGELPTEITEMFMLEGTEKGVKYNITRLNTILLPIIQAGGFTSLQEGMDNCAGATFSAYLARSSYYKGNDNSTEDNLRWKNELNVHSIEWE